MARVKDTIYEHSTEKLNNINILKSTIKTPMKNVHKNAINDPWGGHFIVKLKTMCNGSLLPLCYMP